MGHTLDQQHTGLWQVDNSSMEGGDILDQYHTGVEAGGQ